MITDTMTKYEVMKTLRKEFDEEILPFYRKRIFPQLRSLLQQRCQREKKTISLGWITKKSSNNTEFKILKCGNKEGDLPLFVCEFRWQNKFCFGNFFPEGNVVIYQAHCLQRYAERVLQKDMGIKDVFYKYIAKNQTEAYSIVLPTPTHQYSYYFGMANALFLGDYDINHLDDNFMWCNTCISYNEAKFSQLKITNSLHEIQDYVRKTNSDYCIKKFEKDLKNHLKKIANNPSAREELKEFAVKKYLLWKLHLSFNFDFTEHFRTKIDETMNYIENLLVYLEVNPKSLSPYSKTRGIAWKGEIDFKGV